MKNTYPLFLAVFLAGSINFDCVAAPKNSPQEKFVEQKQKMIQNLQQRLACVTAAQNTDQLHACRPVKTDDGAMGRDYLFKGKGQDVIR